MHSINLVLNDWICVSFLKKLPIGYSINFRKNMEFLLKVNIWTAEKEKITDEFFGTFAGIIPTNDKRNY